MPIVQPAGTELFLSKQGGMFVPVILLDIQTLDGTQYFWSDYEGYYPSKFLTGTRIQSSGGTITQQLAFSLGATVAGDACFVSIVIKNQGASTVDIGTNGNGGDPSAVIPPGMTSQVLIRGVSVGNLFQISFNTSAAGMAWDVVAFNPIGTKNGSANLVPLANRTFAGWTAVGGAAITVTQAFDVAPLQFYNGWIKSGCNFTCTKDMSSNAGDLLLQNLSGNTIDRDVALAFKNHEFEGAYAVTRLWIPLLDAAIREFHCSLSEQNPKEDEAGARELQLFDPTQYVIAGDVQAETCTFRFKSSQCGSTGSATSCLKRLIDCQDATRLAQERFNAIITTIPNTVFVPPLGGPGQKPQRPGATTGGPRSPLPQL
jgi:Tfp pilus assembly protein FimT